MGLPHTYLNIFFSEITRLFDGLFIRLFRSLDQNVYGKNKICSIISCSWPWPILTLLRRSGERLRTFRSSSFFSPQLILQLTEGIQWFNNRENYTIKGYRGVQHFPGGGGGGGGGANANFYRNPYNLWFSRGRGPITPLDLHLKPITLRMARIACIQCTNI